MTQDDILNRVGQIDNEISTKKTERHELLQRWAENRCPLSIGDVVEIAGYSHTGKKGRVVSIGYKEWNRSKEWDVRVVVLKQDGTDTKWIVSFDEGHWARRFGGQS